MNKEVENFLKELKDLEEKYSMQICAAADAADDTNLSCWLEVEKIITDKNGRKSYKVVYYDR